MITTTTTKQENRGRKSTLRDESYLVLLISCELISQCSENPQLPFGLA